MSENQRVIFAENLKYYMKIRHAEQADIVTALNVSASTVSDWVRGKKYPRVDAMQRIADFLGVLISDLTNEENDKAAAILSQDERKLLAVYNTLNPEGQALVFDYAVMISGNAKYRKGELSASAN